MWFRTRAPSYDPRAGVEVLPYKGYTGMCCYEGYGFQACTLGKSTVKIREFGSRIGYHLPGD